MIFLCVGPPFNCRLKITVLIIKQDLNDMVSYLNEARGRITVLLRGFRVLLYHHFIDAKVSILMVVAWRPKLLP